MAPHIIRTVLALATPSDNDGNLFAARDAVVRRDEAAVEALHKGMIPPQNINNNALFALFGILGAAIVCVGIWFFFWAKNGGFYFKEDDWDDYKSTVLRRKGPNGTLLTGATPSTILGGGSVYKDVADDDGSTDITGDTRTVITESTEMTGITGGVSDFVGREKRRKKREAKERDRERRREEKKLNKSKPRKVDAQGNVIDEDAEAEAKAHLRSYRHERPARVGGINKESEGSNWDGSTNPSASSAGGSGYGMGSEVTSGLMDNREATPTNTPRKSSYRPELGTPTKSGGIRKVYSTADRQEAREAERIRAEARRLQDKGRTAGSTTTGSPTKRNFSFQRADDTSSFTTGARGSRLRGVDEQTEASSSRVPGSWAESDAGSEVGTKTYKHVIPGLSSSGSAAGTETTDFAYSEEKRKRRGGAGYRRGRDAE